MKPLKPPKTLNPGPQSMNPNPKPKIPKPETNSPEPQTQNHMELKRPTNSHNPQADAQCQTTKSQALHPGLTDSTPLNILPLFFPVSTSQLARLFGKQLLILRSHIVATALGQSVVESSMRSKVCMYVCRYPLRPQNECWILNPAIDPTRGH